jgi:hypothetical protein
MKAFLERLGERLVAKDWSRVPFLVGATVCLVGAWRIYSTSSDAGDGRTGALALTLIAAVLIGGLLVDWAKRDDHRDDK